LVRVAHQGCRSLRYAVLFHRKWEGHEVQPLLHTKALYAPENGVLIVADMKTCIVLEAFDASVIEDVGGIGDFVFRGTAHSLTNRVEDLVRDKAVDTQVVCDRLPTFSGIPPREGIIAAWRPAAEAMASRIRQQGRALAAVSDADKCQTIYVDTSRVVTQMHYFRALTLPIWEAVAELLNARDVTTSALLVLSRPKPLDGVPGYQRTFAGGRWFVEMTGEGYVLHRCGLDATDGVGYWGTALNPQNYDVADLLADRAIVEKPMVGSSRKPKRKDED